MTGTKKRRPWLAALLSLFCPGLGQVYSTRVGRGLQALVVITVLTAVHRMIFISPPPVAWELVIAAAAILTIAYVIWIGIAVDAFLCARRAGQARLGPWNRKVAYAGIFLGWIAYQTGSIYAVDPFRTLHTYAIPSASNLPTILVGDYLAAWKGYYRDHDPQRGEIAVFKLPTDEEIDYIKRIVGLPGERIQIKDGVLHINGDPVRRDLAEVHELPSSQERTLEVTEYVETLPNGSSYRIWEHSDTEPYDNTPEYSVPPGHYFVLGDNRDNALDSRSMGVVGFVPHRNLHDYPTFIFWSEDWSRIGTLVQPLP